MPMNEAIESNSTNEMIESTTAGSAFEKDKAACGVAMRVNVPREINHQFVTEASHDVVTEAVTTLASHQHRAGYNEMTGESDGSGIKLFSLPTPFFNQKIAEGAYSAPNGETLNPFLLEAGHFVIGHYFLPTDITDPNKATLLTNQAKALIEKNAAKNDLIVVGWRDLNTDAAVDSSILSPNALKKRPAQWQAILLPRQTDASPATIERAALKAGLNIAHEARQKKLKINIVSQSAESIVFKGMIRPDELGRYYRDLQNPLFTATAAASHARFATNTDPQWANAQPCVFFWLHNGELNSAPSNAAEMLNELQVSGFEGVYPDAGLSDSMQFDADIANQMLMKNIPFLEAFVRLMTPPAAEQYSDEINAMLQCFRLNRTPYNGPAFAVAASSGYYLAKLDESALRPSRWGLVEDTAGNLQFYAASEDSLPGDRTVLHRGQLDAGGIILITPQGELLETNDILELVARPYHEKRPYFFQNLLNAATTRLPTKKHEEINTINTDSLIDRSTLNRQLYAAGWDYEAEQSIRYMAEHATERVMAMGNDKNLLHAETLPKHLHHLHAQVSAPPLDSKNEREEFSTKTALGPALEITLPIHEDRHALDATKLWTKPKLVLLDKPLLHVDELALLIHHPDPQVKIHSIDITFEQAATATPAETVKSLRDALKRLQREAFRAAAVGGIIVLSDQQAGPTRIAMPDLIALADIQAHLEHEKLIRNVQIVIDSKQVNGPHHTASLLTMGAKSVYPRGIYEKIQSLFPTIPSPETISQFTGVNNACYALMECLLKNMGKVGINDVNNYINGYFVAAIGLDIVPDGETLENHPTLANLFKRLYSPLRGIQLEHIAANILQRHQDAYAPQNPFTLLPYSGFFMPVKGGLKHGYGREVVGAFQHWMAEEEVTATRFELDQRLEARPDGQTKQYIIDRTIFTPEQGYLNAREKNHEGYYPSAYLERFKPSKAFRTMLSTLDRYRENNPTSLRDHFKIFSEDPIAIRAKLGLSQDAPLTLETQQEIRATFYIGSMSQGALTVTDPKTPHKLGAHETLTRAMNAIGAMSASGEGGQDAKDLRFHYTRTRVNQLASAHFGISAVYIAAADEMEIKIAQGAKPGEGGQIPGKKTPPRIAAQRGGLPNTAYISPPPHHNIYSIEDLAQVDYNLDSVLILLEEVIETIRKARPETRISVKLVASPGIGTIAVGVAKAGAHIINIDGNSGGTGAAQESSITQAGFQMLLGLAWVDIALRKTKYRDLIQIRVSDGLKTAEDVILARIFGADLFGFGNTGMLTQDCTEQRTCNESCQPGVTTDGHLYKGKQINTERYFVNLTAATQERARGLGISLKQLRGRTELLTLIHPEQTQLINFDTILNRSGLPEPLSTEEVAAAETRRMTQLVREKEDPLVYAINTFFKKHPEGRYESALIDLTNQDRSFGTRIAANFALHLEQYPKARIILNTTGTAGQSFGFVAAPGMIMRHHGGVQDDCATSMTGGELILCTPQQTNYPAEENAIAGNVMGYGARGGKIFVNGKVGHRFGVLLHGAQAVVEGAGARAFAFMTSGTGLILGQVGKHLGASASGGILFAYDPGYQLCAKKKHGFIKNDTLYSQQLGFRQGASKRDKGVYMEYMTDGERACNTAENSSAQRISIEIHGEYIIYHVKNPAYTTKRSSRQTISAIINVRTLDPHFEMPVTLDKLQTYLPEILKITHRRGHTYELKPSHSVRSASKTESRFYDQTIREMLQEHAEKTGSIQAKQILASFNPLDFKVLIPKAMDKQYTVQGLLDIIETYLLRETPISAGMKVWLEQKTLEIIRQLPDLNDPQVKTQIDELQALLKSPTFTLFSKTIQSELLERLEGQVTIHRRSHHAQTASLLKTEHSSAATTHPRSSIPVPPKILHPVEERLSNIQGDLDETVMDALTHIDTFLKRITHDAKGCSKCNAQSCSGGDEISTGCPSGKDINRINTTLQQIGPIQHGRLSYHQWLTLREAFAIQIKETPYIAYMTACPAPCKEGCTEAIPEPGGPEARRDGKLSGDPVEIKEIEFYLFQIGRALGWFNGKKQFSASEITQLFGSPAAKEMHYDRAMKAFTPPFQRPDSWRKDKKLIIVGSGPAGMQLAFEALSDRIPVEMYEKSNQFGGLLADGIPPHKFDKAYLTDGPAQLVGGDLADLLDMGLQFNPGAEISYDVDTGNYWSNQHQAEKARIIANAHRDTGIHVALCVGAGLPKTLKPAMTEKVPAQKIIQAIDFLKAANEVAVLLKSRPHTPAEQDALIQEKFKHMDPRHKRVVVVGGGDTAQDVSRWLSRYIHEAMQQFKSWRTMPHTQKAAPADAPAPAPLLNILVRGPQPIETRGIGEKRPAPTKENKLRDEEIAYVGGKTAYLEEPSQIEYDPVSDALTVSISQYRFKYFEQIQADESALKLFQSLPREYKAFETSETGELVKTTRTIEDVDMVICALGFQGQMTIPLIAETNRDPSIANKVSIAGDATGKEQQIIVSAQKSARETFYNRIRGLMGITDKAPLSAPKLPVRHSALAANSLFSAPSAVAKSEKPSKAPVGADPQHSVQPSSMF